MIGVMLELALLVASVLAVVAAGTHFVDSMRAYMAASSSSGQATIRMIVARMGVRATILRFLFALALFACGAVLLRVPNEDMDYPGPVNALAILFVIASILIVIFSLRDLRDRRRIADLLRDHA